MSALVAERYEFGVEQEPYLHMVEAPQVLSLADLPEDELLRRRVNGQIRSLGSFALAEAIIDDSEQEVGKNRTLLDAIRRAADGDQEAVSMLSANVGSDFSERTIKSGEVTKFYLQKTANGEFMQFGQLYSDIYANTLILTPVGSKMRTRTEAETRNAARIVSAEAQGMLNDNCVVVFSACEIDMTDEELDKAGFFSKTKTFVIQATSSEGDQLAVESAFLAGVKNEGEERHDIKTIVKIAAALGYDYSRLTPAEIIDRPLLIPKLFMPHGVIDLVKLADDLAGGTFFGEDKPQEDYLNYRQFCDERRKSFAVDIKIVTNQLLSEVNALYTPYDAIKRLDELSEAQMVRRAIKDKNINARVFGDESASYIEDARYQAEMGNFQAARHAEAMAIKTADSRSCPSGVSRQSELDTINTSLGSEVGKETSSSEEDRYGSLTFKCPRGHRNRRPRNRLIPRCTTCGTSVKC